MSTRAMYTIKDEDDEHHVFIHYDGYPRGAIDWVRSAFPFAWELPRFEADEFAAALVAGAKTTLCHSPCGGGVRLANSHMDYWHIEYRYALYVKEGELQIDAYTTNYCSDREASEDRFYSGDFQTFCLEHEST